MKVIYNVPKAKLPATSHFYQFAYESLVAAQIQIERVWNPDACRANSERFGIPPQKFALIDLHFYFVAMANINRYLRKVAEDPGLSSLIPKIEALNKEYLSQFADARNTLEHLDQRMPGQRYEHRIEEVVENGIPRKIHNGIFFKDGLYRHSNRTWDISINHFEKIKAELVNLLNLLESP